MSRQKVLLLSQIFLPEGLTGPMRVGAMAEALSKEYDVCVVTLKPSYPSPAAYEGFPIERYDAQLPYAIKRTFTFPPHKGGLFARAVREHLMSLGLAARAVPNPADIVVASSPSMFLGPVGLMLARTKRAKFVWDVRDIIWRYAGSLFGASRGVVLGTRALNAYMHLVVPRADLLVGATPGVTQALVESGAEPGKVVTVSNGVSADKLGVLQKLGEGVAHRRPVVAYTGLIGYQQSLGVVLEVAQALPDVDFVLAGDGPERSMLERRAKELGIKNVFFKGWLNKEQLLSVYEASDVLLQHLRDTAINNATSIPGKLHEYMATGRPILFAGGKGLAAEFLSKIGCAVTVPSENPQAMSAAISTLLQDPGRMRTLGLKGRAFVEQNFHRDKFMEELTRTVKERFA